MHPIHLEAIAHERITRLSLEAERHALGVIARPPRHRAKRRPVVIGRSMIFRWLERLPFGFRAAPG